MPSEILKVDSVQLSFGDRKILQDVALQCRRGEIVGLLGRNGCGKSSLLKIIFGSLTPAYKYVSIDDTYIRNGYADGSIAYLPQHPYLPHRVKISRLANLLVDGRCWDEFTAQPIFRLHGHKTVGELSGGERRMLETLLIIYSKAGFILLDEPFTHISPAQTEYLKPLIKARAQHKGIVVTDHQYYNVLGVADKIIIIENGCTKPVKQVEDLVTYNYLSGIK